MGFESIFTASQINKKALTIRSSGACSITKEIAGNHKTISCEVDFEGKRIRLRTGADLERKLTGRIGVCFSVPKLLHRAVLAPGEKVIKIPMTMHDDGWWYGELKLVNND
ncbi:hypothetical protein NSR52_003358 [Salmonella enterica]|nr:hypothetical protein [Salmonella enterica subsp. enterica]EJW2020627.1 hypothetical protein [Salmonella enterica]EJW2025227.1 hypothetical protein [Salmonella enterica]EJW2101173.1 hypothetical protein [Salmonella enterica]